MIRSIIIFIILVHFLTPFRLHGQHSATNEIAARVDNDRFGFNATDRYYSNGITLKWNRTMATGELLKNKGVEKALLILSLQHKIYTPSEITFYDKQRHDRPYASTLTVTGGLRLFVPDNQYLQADLTIGASGPMALGQKLQEWWHRQIDVFKPRGWENQIVNSPVINLHLQFSRQWLDTKFLDLISNSALNLGTILTNIKQGGVVRIGNLLPLNLSIYSGGNLENGPVATKTEIYLQIGGAIEYVHYNGLIEGNWIGSESPHTRETIRWVYHGEYGIYLSAWKINAGFSYHALSREVRDGTKHQYASLKLGFRF